MKSLRLSILAAALVLGACSSSTPTDPARLDGAASFDEGPGTVGSGHFTSETEDGGNMLGSGNGVGTSVTEDGGGMLGSGNGVGTMGSGGGTSSSGTTTTSDTGGTTISSDTTPQRGPGMMGSGN